MVEHQAKKDARSLGARLTKDGVEFRVWAPFAKFVSVMIRDSFATKETILASEGDGYWSGLAPGVKAGQTYKYHLQSPDGNWIDRNDPHARQLTVSDNGESVIIDHAFDWEGDRLQVVPREKQIMYELHIGTFNRPDAGTPGTFQTAIEKLDYLESLGINMIELMPVTSMAKSNGWGYEPNHLYAVENTYGGRHGLLEFVKAAHKRGIGVILDTVYNHFSTQTDIWQFDGWSENGRGGIYFYNDERGDTPWGGRPDYGRTEVRQFILDNVAMWLTEYHLDGLRLDSTIYMRNKAGKNDDPANDIADAWSLFQDITSLAHKINPNALIVAEDYSLNEFITKSVAEGGAGFDAQWGTAFPLAIRAALGMDSHDYGGNLVSELQHIYNGQPLQKIIFSDSHDTAANGSTRINEATTPGNAESVLARQRSLLANAVTLTAPGIPMLLQGEEFMQEGSFSDWKMLEWAKTKQFAGIVLANQHLINLRLDTYHNTTGLTGPSINVFHENVADNVFAYQRWGSGGPNDDVLVIVNCSNQSFKEYKLNVPVAGMWHVRFNSSWKGYSPDFSETKTSTVTTDGDSQIVVELSDYNVLILSQDPTSSVAA